MFKSNRMNFTILELFEHLYFLKTLKEIIEIFFPWKFFLIEFYKKKES